MKIVAIGGSLRKDSSNAALLRAASQVSPGAIEMVMLEGLGGLPHFNPDLDLEGMTPPKPVAEMRRLLIESDAVVISSPEYAHGVPGVLKNLLDWVVSTGELVGKPVALLNASPAGGSYAQASLAETLRTMNWTVVPEASLIEPFVGRRIVGELTDEAALAALRGAMNAFHQFILRR